MPGYCCPACHGLGDEPDRTPDTEPAPVLVSSADVGPDPWLDTAATHVAPF